MQRALKAIRFGFARAAPIHIEEALRILGISRVADFPKIQSAVAAAISRNSDAVAGSPYIAAKLSNAVKSIETFKLNRGENVI